MQNEAVHLVLFSKFRQNDDKLKSLDGVVYIWDSCYIKIG